MQQIGWERPDPPGVKPVRGTNPWLLPIIVLVLGLLLYVALRIPIPVFYRFLPGPMHDVQELVEIEGAQDYSSEGQLYLTTVSIDTEVTFAEWVGTIFDEDKIVVMKNDVTGGGTDEQLIEQAEQQMKDSKQNAQLVALAELGLLPPSARITSVLPNSPAAGTLKPGDRILAIDGQTVRTSCETGAEIADREVGDRIVITIERAERRRTFELRTESLTETQPPRPMIGVEMETEPEDGAGLPEVEIDSGEIGGPSAGVMFALAIYDRLTPDDLTHGHPVAGTGVIACDGSVQPIGGIEQKIAAAEARNVEIFLTPTANVEAARSVAENVRIEPIATFDDALAALEALD